MAAALLLLGTVAAGCNPPAGPSIALLPTGTGGTPGEPMVLSGGHSGIMLPPELPPSAVAALGTWYLRADGAPATLRIGCDQGSACAGSLYDPALAITYEIDGIRWSVARGELAFRVIVAGRAHFYRLRVVEGVLVGRYATVLDYQSEPDDPRAYAVHVTGWKGEYFDRDIVPRVYDLMLDSRLYATLRIDRRPGAMSGQGPYQARIKVYASQLHGATDEDDEYDAVVETWDGTRLDFSVPSPAWPRTFHGDVNGRLIVGDFAVPGETEINHWFSGARAEVLTHGFVPVTAAEREAWQVRTRKMLALLTMNGDPAPLDVKVTVLRSDVAPRPSQFALPDRDDNPDENPQAYRLTELSFEATIADPNAPAGGAPLVRRIHGWYAMPTGEPPLSGVPVVMALNGHTGSAAATMDPDSEYFWYGDAYARRGYAVLAIDIGHRPVSDRRGLYDLYVEGDDLGGGNGLHPAIRSPDMDSDWAEDGERLWDVTRGLDWLLAQPGIDRSRVLVSGLSMGGEMTTIAGAMDPRYTVVVPAGFSPDISTLLWRGSHGCWKWNDADIREYIDTSDLHALVAPRPLIVETGKIDEVYSLRDARFASDKQVMRRSRAAWADAPDKVFHYLHYDQHHFHVGGVNPARDTERNVRVPLLEEPEAPYDPAWQTDAATVDTGVDLFELLSRLP